MESEFPKDILCAATEAMDKAGTAAQCIGYRELGVPFIAESILAERRRYIELCRRAGSPEWSDDTNSGYELAAREIAEDIEKGR